MRVSAAIFQNISPSGSRWDWRFGECLQKKISPSGSRLERHFYKRFTKKFQKNNSAQVGQNFQNQLPDKLSGIKNRLPTKLVGSKKSHF